MIPATPGSIVRFDGASTQEACNVGTYSGSGESECTPCANGTYASKPGSASCKLADAGSYVPDDNRTKQIQCDEGYLSPGPGASECIKCSLGTFAANVGATKCDDAAAGYYVPVAGSSTQTKCKAGFARTPLGQSACLPATPGFKVPKEGSTKPEACTSAKRRSPTLLRATSATPAPSPASRARRAANSPIRATTSRVVIERDSSSACSAVTRRAQGRRTSASNVRWVRLPPPRV